MKAPLKYALVLLAGFASAQSAQAAIDAKQKAPSVTELMEQCRSEELSAEAKVACFNDLADQLRNGAAAPSQAGSVQEALDGLRRVAEYQDKDSGLVIAGDSCLIHVLYYGNYFHISRRNVSTIDLLSAKFDASTLQFDQTADVSEANLNWSKGVMDAGATAVFQGGTALESNKQGFDAKQASLSLQQYAGLVVDQLPAQESQRFDFMMVHPAKAEARAEITKAFEELVSACKS